MCLHAHAQGVTACTLPPRVRDYQADSISARISAASGGSGVSLELRPREHALDRIVDPLAVGPELAQPSRAAAERLDADPRGRPASCRARGRARSSACSRAGASPPSCRGSIAALVSACGIRNVRTSVWARRRGAARTSPSRLRTRTGSSRGRAGPGRAWRGPCRGPWRAAPPLAGPPSSRPGWRAACTASRRRGRGRSWRSRAGAAPGRLTITGWIGEHDLWADQPVGRLDGPREAGGCGSDRRPRASRACAATRVPLTAAIAFAASITRPPPSATRSRAPASSISRAATSLTGPGGTW